MKNKIAMLPNPDNQSHEWCSICSDDNIVAVVQGKTNCYYCGNTIVLCSKHAKQLFDELKELVK